MAWSTLDIFFELLRSGLYGTVPDIHTDGSAVDWRAILRLAKKQTVTGLVADGVSRLALDQQPPRDVMLKLMQRSVSIIDDHGKLEGILALVVTQLRSAGIEPVLLKGQGVARCYREPKLRQCGDIDLYVGDAAYAQACRLATERLHDRPETPEETPKHIEVFHHGVSIELHRYAAKADLPWRDKEFQQWISGYLDNSARHRTLNVEGIDVSVPAADFDALYIFFHAWHHLLMKGIGLRQMCDIAMVLHRHKDEIDRDKLERALRKMHLLRAWRAVGWILVNRLGLPADEMPLYSERYRSRGLRVLDISLKRGAFGGEVGGSLAPKESDSYLTHKIKWGALLLGGCAKLWPVDPKEMTLYFMYRLWKGAGRTIRRE